MSARVPGAPMQRECFDRDLERLNAELERLGAVITLSDGWRGIDEAKVPADLLRTYRELISYGWANGHLAPGAST
ncbi:hypothetical protein [Parafrankia sp. FMc2]|uniref:hypothetical protein n=1 Tax=Parafrankia sp. FMc2 TaxID=3233196 RepID=UPI0034D5E0B3